MSKHLAFLLFLLSFVACQNELKKVPEPNQSIEVNKEPVTVTPPKPEVKPEVKAPVDSVSLDSLWHKLVFIKGGCLSGGQDFGSGGEGCVMNEATRTPTKWPVFFSFPKHQLAHFLIEQLADTTKSQIHTCPCYPAIGGEVAVYALHRVFEKNWYSLEGFTEYGKRPTKGCHESYQWWLQAILKDDAQRAQFTEAWVSEVNKI